MKRKLPLITYLIFLFTTYFAVFYFGINTNNQNHAEKEIIPLKRNKKKKTSEERALYSLERIKHELKFQINPKTGKVPIHEKKRERNTSISIKRKTLSQSKTTNSIVVNYISRGPSNLGGRTRSIVFDKTDQTSNTIIAGGVSSGVFRTTDGGTDWTKVSNNNHIHNVTTIAQDPRVGSENIWYYGTGEFSGNSGGSITESASPYLGQGIWQSTDSGVTWTQMPSTASSQTSHDSIFDVIHKIVVHPITGHLYAATLGSIKKFDGATWSIEINSATSTFTDIAITSTGIVYAGFPDDSGAAHEGVWQLPNGGTWARIGSSVVPGIDTNTANTNDEERIVLAIAPSNENIVYAFHINDGIIEAGLWQWNDATDTWVDYSAKMPDELDGDKEGNDPISVQGGYDMVVSVKPDDENFVVIGGTNAYKIEDITTYPTFVRIGGYKDNTGYADYDLDDPTVGNDPHHADIHALVFDPNNQGMLYSGTDGGVHKANATSAVVGWKSLNNNYQTYQYYHVAIDPSVASDMVIGGTQDNGTSVGGIIAGNPDLTTMYVYSGGDGVAVGISRDDGCVPFFFGSQGGDIYRDCPTSDDITPTEVESQFVTYFYLDPSNNNALYYAAKKNMYRTTQSSTVTSATWDNMGDITVIGGYANEWISQYSANWGVYNAASSYLLIGGDAGSLLRLNDPQNAEDLSTAVDITPTGFTKTYPHVVSGIAVHPTNPDIVLLSYSNYGILNLYHTTNATDAVPVWTVVERNLADFSIRSVAIAEVGGETIYFAGTARGLYSSTDPNTTDWNIESSDLIGFALVSALAYKPSNNKLLIGTHGNGMFEGTIINNLSLKEVKTVNSSFTAYPNPSSSVLNIVLEGSVSQENLKYSIYDMKGSKILKGKLDSNKQIIVDALSNGSYILTVDSKVKINAIVFAKKS